MTKKTQCACDTVMACLQEQGKQLNRSEYILMLDELLKRISHLESRCDGDTTEETD